MSLPLESVKLETMASGHLCLCLTEAVDYDGFPAYAKELLAHLGGRVTYRGDAADVRIWKVVISGAKMLLVFDDMPLGVTLESDSAAADAVLRLLLERLRR